MITVDSIVEKLGDKYYPITFKKNIIDDDSVEIYVYKDDPYNCDVLIAKLTLTHLTLVVYRVGTFYLEYNFNKYNYDTVNELLNSGITEEELISWILDKISTETENQIVYFNNNNDEVKLAMKKLRQNNQDNTLKPCPFCGDTYIMTHKTITGKYVVGCNTLDCIALHITGKLYDSADDAAKAWNRRTNGNII